MELGIVFFVIFAILKGSYAVAENDNLKSVVVIYRHGARTPVKLYKNDPYATKSDDIWPEGFGQLNEEGIWQQFLLGKWLRQRYDNFIRPKYHVGDILVSSSNSDRCLMSASSNLAGFYASSQTQSNQIMETWRPVPVHTEPADQDALLAGGKPCPKFVRLYAELLKTDTFVELFEEHVELLEYLSYYSGEDIKDFTGLIQLNDALKVESFYNLTLPDWTQEIYPQKIGEMIEIYWTTPTYTTELSRLRTGPLIDKITKQLEATSDHKPNTPKMLMLSAHDSTLVHLLNALGLYDKVTPEYAATIIFELRKGNDKEYINIFYKNDTYSVEAHAKTLHGCDVDCDLKEFRKIVAPIRVDLENWDKECSDL